MKAFTKKCTVLLLCLAFLLVGTGCGRSFRTEAVEDYGQFNNLTKSIFDKYNWESFLPDKELAARYCTEYIYDFKYVFLDDHSFYIYAVFQYDADSFAAEIARIEETPGLDSSLPDCIEAGGKTYYLVNGETGGFYGFSSYCDDEILDGKPYCMDVAAVDTQRMRIEYLTAFQWDAGRDDFVVGFIAPLLEDTIA